MKLSYKKSFIALTLASLISCGGSSSSKNDDSDSYAKFSLGVSDAPVDDAEAVYIEVTSITLQPVSSDSGEDTSADDAITITDFTNDAGESVESIKVNLLDFQGSEQLKIVDEAQNVELATGNYRMTLEVVDAGSYVLLENDATEHAIKVPSSKLQLGEFAVSTDAVQVGDTPAYTIEFDLRQSLVQRGNAQNNNGYIVKPTGVRIVSLAGDIEGTVDASLTNLGVCTVYLYEGSATEFGDIYDAADEDFVAPQDAITAAMPLATSVVDVDGGFAIGFVSAGSYKLALNCSTDVDDNIQFDGLTIPSSADGTSPDAEVQTIQVSSQATTNVIFE